MNPETTPDHDVVIVGAGFGGIGMAIRLRQQGGRDFVVLEKDSGIGGTWWANTYPGCACDVQSFLYSYSFEPNPDWTRMFAPQEEIRTYLERCVDKYGVRDHIELGAHVTGLEWDEAAGLWRVEIGGGERTLTARAIVAGFGGLSRPAYPAIDGLDDFDGPLFHSAEWDHGFDPAGKRVAVIGTGASAIQFVPEVRGRAEHVDLYQRTPPWVLPRPDRAISEREQSLYRRFPILQRAYRAYIYLMLEARVPLFTRFPRLLRIGELLAKRAIRKDVSDPELERRLTPDFAIGCKRILLSSNYYEALASPNVSVHVDAIERVTEHGVVAGGVEREADAIILGTGFEPTDVFAVVDIRGRNGISLRESWAEAAQAYKGTTIAGYPNLFLIVGPNVGLGHSSMILMIESQIAYIAGALDKMDALGIAAVDVREDVQDAYNEDIQRRLASTVWQTGGCTSWYQDESGRITALWPGSTVAFRRATREFDIGAYRTVGPSRVATSTSAVAAGAGQE